MGETVDHGLLNNAIKAFWQVGPEVYFPTIAAIADLRQLACNDLCFFEEFVVHQLISNTLQQQEVTATEGNGRKQFAASTIPLVSFVSVWNVVIFCGTSINYRKSYIMTTFLNILPHF